jgi:predicted nuclease with TOPRIM domain
MPQASARVSADFNEGIETYSAEHDGFRSDAIRALLEQGIEYDRVQAENDRLRRQLQATNARQEDVGELVEYVEQEKSMQEQRQERLNALIWRRAKHWVFGYSEQTQ